MLTLCVNAVKKTPRLLQCDPQSVLGAMMASAALGLEPNTAQQQAFLIPYRKRVPPPDGSRHWIEVFECQFQIGYRGFITLAYRCPHVRSLQAEAIHEGDFFEHMQGSVTFLKYRKSLGERGGLLGAFSHVHLASGIELACVLRLEDLLKVRACSETYNALVRAVDAAETAKERAAAERRLAETPWVAWEDAMASKSAIKLQCKALPLSGSDALALAAEIDSRSEAGALDLGAMADPDAVRAVVAGEAEPPALQPPQEPDIDLSAMPMHAGRADVPVAAVAAAPAPPPVAAPAAAASTARPMAPPPQARRGFDADAFAEQMQRAADKGDAQTLDALGEQLRDVPGEDLRATLTDMHERLRAGLDQPRQPEAPQRPQPGMPPVPPARRRTAP